MSRQINRLNVKKLSVGLFVSSTLVAIAAQLLVAAPAKADCVYEGKTYKTDETVGNLVCMPDGSWAPQ